MKKLKRYKKILPVPQCAHCPMGVQTPLSKSVCLVCISLENDRLHSELSETRKRLERAERDLERLGPSYRSTEACMDDMLKAVKEGFN